MKKPIKAYTISEIAALIKHLGQPSFRVDQLISWLYNQGSQSYEEMTTLPASLRARLTEDAPLFTPSILDRQESADGTRKYLVRYEDGILVETVAIPSRNGDRLTVCFSTQAGCPLACSFCATGKEGFTRNLLVGEIVDQIILAQSDFGKRVSNVVGMGQGEPFLNYDNTIAALQFINDSRGLGIGARHMSVSTSGVIPGIQRFACESKQYTLAISLHAARQSVRDSLMPKVARFKLTALKTALKEYVRKTNRRVTFEYIMIREVNDSLEDLLALQRFCSGVLCHVNLIPLNQTDNAGFAPSTERTIDFWMKEIRKKGVESTIRVSRGSDIAGACGQLKNTRLQ